MRGKKIAIPVFAVAFAFLLLAKPTSACAAESDTNADAQIQIVADTQKSSDACGGGVLAAGKLSYSEEDLRLLASLINCEAGGESMQGKIAVGIVVMNRVDSEDFPNTISKVIYQKKQFSPVTNGSLNRKLQAYDAGKTKSKQWKQSIRAAKKVLKGQKSIILQGSTKNMDGYYFFSVNLKGAKFKLGGHKFK